DRGYRRGDQEETGAPQHPAGIVDVRRRVTDVMKAAATLERGGELARRTIRRHQLEEHGLAGTPEELHIRGLHRFVDDVRAKLVATLRDVRDDRLRDVRDHDPEVMEPQIDHDGVTRSRSNARMPANDVSCGISSGPTVTPNSSSTTARRLIVLSESQPGVLSSRAPRISATLSFGRTAWQHSIRRVSRSSIGELPYGRIEARSTSGERRSGQLRAAARLLAQEVGETVAQRLVARGLDIIEAHGLGAGAPKQLIEAAVLEAAGERAAAHHPAVEGDRRVRAPAGEHGDATERPEAIL